MADHIMYNSTPKVREKAPLWLWIVVWVLAAIVVLQLGFQYLVAPNFRITRIEIQGKLPVDQGDFIRLTGLSHGVYYHSIDETYVADQLSSVPEIASVEVIKIFPDTVRLNIANREPVVTSLLHMDDITVPVSIDDQGILYILGYDPKAIELPVISGLIFDETITAGAQLPEK